MSGEGDGHRRWGWAFALLVLGWVVITAATVGALFAAAAVTLAPPDVGSDEKIGTIAILAAVASAVIALGTCLILAVRSMLPRPRASRFLLWAKLCIAAACELCVGVPLFFYGVALRMDELTHDPTVGPSTPLDGQVVAFTAMASIIPAAIGLAAIVVAVIWGRRKPPPDVVTVFN